MSKLIYNPTLADMSITASRTLSLTLGRPSTDLEICDAQFPQPFLSLSDSDSTLLIRDGYFLVNNSPNDDEAVALFNDLIEAVHHREEILRGGTKGSVEGSPSKQESVAEILSQWRQSSRLHRPLDFDTYERASLRASIADLALYNSIISVDRHLKHDFGTRMSLESRQAARATIKLITETNTNGMTMCLWYVF